MSSFYRFGEGPRSSFYIACEPAHLEENWRKIERKRATGGGGKMIYFFRAYEPARRQRFIDFEGG